MYEKRSSTLKNLTKKHTLPYPQPKSGNRITSGCGWGRMMTIAEATVTSKIRKNRPQLKWGANFYDARRNSCAKNECKKAEEKKQKGDFNFALSIGFLADMIERQSSAVHK
jgi:hypothetical protein